MNNKIKVALIATASLSCGVIIGYKVCQKIILMMVNDKEYMSKIITPIVNEEKVQQMMRSYFKQPRVRSEDVIFQERGEAEAVLDSLCQIINDYGHATLSDLDDLIGNSGWTDLKDVTIKKIIHGYVIELPNPQIIKSKGE